MSPITMPKGRFRIKNGRKKVVGFEYRRRESNCRRVVGCIRNCVGDLRRTAGERKHKSPRRSGLLESVFQNKRYFL